jgi:hypothetical protein
LRGKRRRTLRPTGGATCRSTAHTPPFPSHCLQCPVPTDRVALCALKVPLHVRAKLSWYNVPVTGGDTDAGSALGVLRAVAKPEDFVVIKVDAQGSQRPRTPTASVLSLSLSLSYGAALCVGQVDVDGGPELEIVRAIADDVNGVASLVDELYFEYHFYFDGLNFGWQTHLGGAHRSRNAADVDDALHLMRRLRERGIRAYFWI